MSKSACAARLFALTVPSSSRVLQVLQRHAREALVPEAAVATQVRGGRQMLTVGPLGPGGACR